MYLKKIVYETSLENRKSRQTFIQDAWLLCASFLGQECHNKKWSSHEDKIMKEYSTKSKLMNVDAATDYISYKITRWC